MTDNPYLDHHPENAMEETTVITGAANIEAARLVAVRGALKLETNGLKRHGRSARTLANEAMGTNYKTIKKTYTEFNRWLVENYDAIDRPLGAR
jgi:hypothetical protein